MKKQRVERKKDRNQPEALRDMGGEILTGV